VAEPWNPDAIIHAPSLDAGPNRVDPPNDLVAWDDWQLRIGQLAIDDMQVRAAHTAGGHP
jgi:hypothetical protein